MGGLGSGRYGYYGGSSDTTEDYRSLDIRRWRRDGLLTTGRSFGWNWTRNDETIASIQVRVQVASVVLVYRYRKNGGDWIDESYTVSIDRTQCNLGGTRPWFICPVRGCGRRVALLYGGAIFACRRCYRLSYASQRERRHDRSARRADRIRDKLEWEPGILNGEGSKPTGMHWRTFERLRAEHDAHVGESLAGMAARFGFRAGR